VEQYTSEDSLKEALVFGLRMIAGVNISELELRYDCKVPDELHTKINTLIKRELLIYNDSQLATSPKGLLLLNSVMEYLW
jgi:coproporphyrinogen III oxidase-like Fe-S oxidoreductase